MVNAIGTITGSSEYKVAFISGTYTWTLLTPRIELIKDSARFITDVNVQAGPFDYTTTVPGKAHIAYDMATNKINIRITDAVFGVYTKIFGKKIHLKDIQLADYFTTPFQFEGPMSLEAPFDFELPDKSVKKIVAKPANCILQIHPQQIVLNAQLVFLDVNQTCK